MKILRIIGYVAFFLISLVVGVYLTFPWDALKGQLELQVAANTGWTVEMDELRPSWVTGVDVRGLEVTSPDVEEPLVLDRVVARAHVLAFLLGSQGVSVWSPLGNGELDVDLRKGGERTLVKAQAKSVELGLLRGFAAFTGLPLSGEVDLDADLDLSDEDPSKSSGTVNLAGEELELGEGGKVGTYPIPVALRLGSFDWKIDVQEGKADIPRQEIRGGDVDLDLQGNVNLQKDLERTTLNLQVSFKPQPEFLKENQVLELLLNNIRRAKGSDGFYTYAVSGSIKYPRTTPRRR